MTKPAMGHLTSARWAIEVTRNCAQRQARGALDSLNVKEMAMLCEDLCLFDSKYGAREMLAAFVRVNIDDELYEAEVTLAIRIHGHPPTLCSSASLNHACAAGRRRRRRRRRIRAQLQRMDGDAGANFQWPRVGTLAKGGAWLGRL
eukprot:1248173-Prymnesium_polylepis.1